MSARSVSNDVKLMVPPERLRAVRQDFYARGQTVADWSRDNGFKAVSVYLVLQGRRRCLRGECHRIAVKLGLKDVPHAPQTGSANSTNHRLNAEAC